VPSIARIGRSYRLTVGIIRTLIPELFASREFGLNCFVQALVIVIAHTRVYGSAVRQYVETVVRPIHSAQCGFHLSDLIDLRATTWAIAQTVSSRAAN
jgi:hypothetical protein